MWILHTDNNATPIAYELTAPELTQPGLLVERKPGENIFLYTCSCLLARCLTCSARPTIDTERRMVMDSLDSMVRLGRCTELFPELPPKPIRHYSYSPDSLMGGLISFR